MLNLRSKWHTLAWHWLAISSLCGCPTGEQDFSTPTRELDASGEPSGSEEPSVDSSAPLKATTPEPDASDGSSGTEALPVDASAPPNASTFLELRDGGQIPSQGLRCGYRQNTGADDSLDLQLQYLSAPNAVAFSAYITDPVPAKPFVATPRDVKRFDFEAVAGGNYSAKLQEAEITLRLDDLPAPSSLEDRKVVHLHGTLEITAFSLPARTTAEGSDAGTLDLAPATVAVDCMPGFFLNPVLN